MSNGKNSPVSSLSIDNSKPTLQLTVPVNWQALGFNKSVSKARLLVDGEGNLILMPTIPVGYGMQGAGNTIVQGSNAQTLYTVTGGLVTSGDNVAGQTAQRTPNYFMNQNGLTANGYTSVWVPAAGKRFRLMSGNLVLSKEAACAAGLTIYVCDNITGTSIFIFDVSTAALVAMGQPVIIPLPLSGNGYLSQAKNNILKIFLSGALTAGSLSFNGCGCEE